MNARHERAGTPAHVPALDGLRGVAILLVLASHAVMWWEPAGVGLWLAAVARSGWLGVDLFFALSGYLITGMRHTVLMRPADDT